MTLHQVRATSRKYLNPSRKELYELLFPSTAHGASAKMAAETRWGDDACRNNCDTHEGPERFTLNTAKATGKSERTIQMAATIGKKLKKDALGLVGTSLNSITELDALSKLDPETRRALIKRAIAGEQVSAKAAKPKRERAPNKDRKPPANDNAPYTPIPMMDLTAPDHADAILAVGEAAADARFFPGRKAAGNASLDSGGNDHGINEAATPSSPAAEMISAAKNAAFAQVIEAMQTFERWDQDWRLEFANKYDLTSFFDAYRSARKIIS